MRTDTPTRRIMVDQLARVEGEGGLMIRTREDGGVDVNVRIFEPPRFFEALLRGRHFREAPDITARICGICPVAHQVTAVRALEHLFGVRLPQAHQDLRRAMYLGEWLESHALHVGFLHAPDFLGYADAMRMAQDHPEAVQRARRLKAAGRDLTALVGGRGIHPINVRVGGLYDPPRPDEVAPVLEAVRRARDDAAELVRWVSRFEFPDFEQDCEYVALRHEDLYPVDQGRLVSDRALDCPASEFEERFTEEQVPHSTALHSVVRGRGSYAVGPLARYSLNFDRLPEPVRAAAREAGLGPTCRNPFQSIVVRSLEALFCCEDAVRLLERYEVPDRPAVDFEPRAGLARACTEAPRGLLYHRYAVDWDGLVSSASLIPPTAQNQKTMEADLRRLVPTSQGLDREKLTWLCEQAIRNYDPCISCATH